MCDFGHVKYTLKATVHRAGAFTTKLTAVKDVNVVSCFRPDSTDEIEHHIVERQWEEQLHYLIELEHTFVTMGDLLQMNLKLLPLDKLSLHRISISLEGLSSHSTSTLVNVSDGSINRKELGVKLVYQYEC